MAAQSLTPFSRIHPYPAMIADGLARELCARFVKTNDVVLDPFVGTGRALMAASEFGAHGVGIDINPLAVLVASAKARPARPADLERVGNIIRRNKLNSRATLASIFPRRKVEWFSRRTLGELGCLIELLNDLDLDVRTVRTLAVVLSATVREVSYCRKDQWKLHRMPEHERMGYYVSVKEAFLRRLAYVVREINRLKVRVTSCQIYLGDSRRITDAMPVRRKKTMFDIVITSPPYGDSRTTVQYGAFSDLSLRVLSGLAGYQELCGTDATIDSQCLGGGALGRPANGDVTHCGVSDVWRGDVDTVYGRRVIAFLNDLSAVCGEIAAVVRTSGKIILVVSRRTTGGQQLFLDRFLIGRFTELRCNLVEKRWRAIVGKMTPHVVTINARACSSGTALPLKVKTMRRECVLVFQKG